jgi:hypothetical protein
VAKRKRKLSPLLFFRLSMLLALMLVVLFFGPITDALSKYLIPKVWKELQPGAKAATESSPTSSEPTKPVSPETPSGWDPAKDPLPPGMSRQK